MSKEAQYYKKLLIIVIIIFSSVLVGETFYLAGLRRQMDMLREEMEMLGESIEPITLRVSLLVKYDNGTKVWFNNTLVPVGWSLFNLTLHATKGNVEYQASYFGLFVTSINNVKQYGSNYWLWYRWDPESQDWTLGETGADSYMLRRNDVLAWYLADTSKYPNIDKP